MTRPQGRERPPKPAPPADRDGYFGIGILGAKRAGTLGALSRSAHAFGASLVFAIAFSPTRVDMRSDTTKAERHLSLVEYSTVDEFLRLRPPGCDIVGVEYRAHGAKSLAEFTHPARALYLLGAEDSGLAPEALAACDHVIQIPSHYPLNVATADSVVLYDRVSKRGA